MRLQLRAGALMIALTVGMFLPQTGQAQELKIAVVDIEALTLNSIEGKAVQDKLKKRYDEITVIMQKLQKEVDDKETQLKTQDRVMSAASKAALSRDIEDKKLAFDRKNQDYQKEMSDMQGGLMDPVSAKASAMLQAMIKEGSYNVVFDLAADKGNIVWANPANDITLTVIKRVDDEYKKTVGTAAAPAAAAPRTPAATAPATTTPRPPAATPAAPGR